MHDSKGSSDKDPEASGWLLLIHQLPPKPDYFRVKIRRRLRQLGAAALRGSVYVLPESDESLEDFQWLAGEIRAEGGEAVLCRADFVDGISEEELRAMFTAKASSSTASGAKGTPEQVEPGRTWVTRRNVHVDRMASAWLIRRFIDPKARFKFVPPRGYHAESGELRFDMHPAEYSHEGELCTFQVLLERFGLSDPALAAMGEVVRDIDCKDTKFGRSETAGIAALIAGIANAELSDEARLEEAAPVFERLLHHFGARRP
jgi:hypothetical protein